MTLQLDVTGQFNSHSTILWNYKFQSFYEQKKYTLFSHRVFKKSGQVSTHICRSVTQHMLTPLEHRR